MVEEQEDGRVVEALELPAAVLEDAQQVVRNFGGAYLRITIAMMMLRKVGNNRG